MGTIKDVFSIIYENTGKLSVLIESTNLYIKNRKSEMGLETMKKCS